MDSEKKVKRKLVWPIRCETEEDYKFFFGVEKPKVPTPDSLLKQEKPFGDRKIIMPIKLNLEEEYRLLSGHKSVSGKKTPIPPKPKEPGNRKVIMPIKLDLEKERQKLLESDSKRKPVTKLQQKLQVKDSTRRRSINHSKRVRLTAIPSFKTTAPITIIRGAKSTDSKPRKKSIGTPKSIIKKQNGSSSNFKNPVNPSPLIPKAKKKLFQEPEKLVDTNSSENLSDFENNERECGVFNSLKKNKNKREFNLMDIENEIECIISSTKNNYKKMRQFLEEEERKHVQHLENLKLLLNSDENKENTPRNNLRVATLTKNFTKKLELSQHDQFQKGYEYYSNLRKDFDVLATPKRNLKDLETPKTASRKNYDLSMIIQKQCNMLF